MALWLLTDGASEHSFALSSSCLVASAVRNLFLRIFLD